MSGESILTGTQAAALLDILTHHGTYAEIEAFKLPTAVTSYGYPFRRTTRVPPPPPTPSILGGRGIRTSTPTGSAPPTPRARTPVSSFFWGRQDVNNDNDDDDGHDDDDNNDKEEGSEGGEVVESESPLLQMLLKKLVLGFPGVRELGEEFWGVRVQGLLGRFGEAGMSESYDKGAMGTRKTLASGGASVLEMLARGVLIGTIRRQQEPGKAHRRRHRLKDKRYDIGNAEDLERAWDDCVQEWAYGGLLDELFDHFAKTKDIEGHSPAIEAAVDYAIVHLATFAHQILVLSPEGQYLVKLLESINGLVPYRMITQTLRVGNAAVMISGMVRLLLTKLSVTSLTNWVGLTASADDGMNLLQRIIWIVLSYDASEFRKSADKVERAAKEGNGNGNGSGNGEGQGQGDRPSEEMLVAIREHVAKPRAEHDAVRRASVERSQSIVAAILECSGKGKGSTMLASSLSAGQHAKCLAYYSALLSARDRESIIGVLCRQAPDLFTQVVRDVISAFEPIIRSVHARVDLREHLESAQKFITELIRVSKPRASVEEFVKLLRNNKHLLYKWIHAVAKGCPDVWADLRVWAKAVAVEFRERAVPGSGSKSEPGEIKAGEKDGPLKDIRGCLDDLLRSLGPDARAPIMTAVDAHAAYLSEITLTSRRRLQRIIDRSRPPPKADDDDGDDGVGPGVYLFRWQDTLDSTPITPSEASGPLRRGRDVRHATTMGKSGPGGKVLDADWGPDLGRRRREAPDVAGVVDALGGRFRVAVRERIVMWEAST